MLQQYAPVAQDDDIEQDAHDHSAASPAPPQPESIAQTIASVFRPKPHVHCETCDAQTQARERRENERHCCGMVAGCFIMFFICAMILGVVIANNMGNSKRH
jgi:hypothetical protein